MNYKHFNHRELLTGIVSEEEAIILGYLECRKIGNCCRVSGSPTMLTVALNHKHSTQAHAGKKSSVFQTIAVQYEQAYL
jgi:hypothetical protein